MAVTIIRRREALGLRQNQIAAISGLTRQYISMVERQERMPSLETMLKICKGLDIHGTDFMDQLLESVKSYQENRPVRYLVRNSPPLKLAENERPPTGNFSPKNGKRDKKP
ncbi:MAG TPA: helix-turn-helix transcriptional regulator [Fibrobacteraceae bacterium]|nr:helix-turn-helix transcriptional regulator [Fibrobacteraceae bacterium]